MAMALAATVVKRKEITATMSSPMRACQILWTTPPNAKKANVTIRAMMMPKTTVFIGRSLWVRSSSPVLAPSFLENSLAAMPTADLMTPKLLMMPMIPAVAIPPMPMWRA